MKRKFPLWGFIGVILIILFWYINWNLEGLRTHWAFFPLWLGYALFIDGLVFRINGDSLISRSYKKFILLFFISAPAWWLFELFNSITHNWQYIGKEYFSDLEYFLLASLSFSTVMPAVFETAELLSASSKFDKFRNRKKFNPTKKVLWGFIFTGLFFLLMIVLFPNLFFPFVWATVLLILEPVNYFLGNKTLFDYWKTGNWKPLISLALGCLICGFFWEMWNYYSYPKWVYHLPIAEFLHVFEMPVLGYLGYLTFPLELFSIYHFITGFFIKKSVETYIKIA